MPGTSARAGGAGTLGRTVAGWLLIGAGVLGLALPVMPGIPLLLAGLALLSSRYRWAAVWMRWLKRRVLQGARALTT